MTTQIITSTALGGFEAAARTRLSPTPPPIAGAADYHRGEVTRDILRRECHKALRNDPVAKALVRRKLDAAIGDRITINVQSGDPDFDRAAEEYLNAWAEKGCEFGAPAGRDDDEEDLISGEHGDGGGRTFTQLTRLAMRSWWRDGDCLIIRTEDGRLQMIEAERVRDPLHATNIRGVAEVKGGVCFDALGRTVGYCVAEWDKRSGGGFAENRTEFVPAAAAMHIKNATDDEIGLTRPEPGLAAALPWLRQIRQYTVAVGAAAQMAAMFGLVIESAAPAAFAAALPASSFPALSSNNPDGGSVTGGGIGGVNVSLPRSQQNPRAIGSFELEPGFIGAVKPGEKISQVQAHQPTQEYWNYVLGQLAVIGAEHGIPLSILTLDMRGQTFANAKGAIILFWMMTVATERYAIETQFMRPSCRWKLARGIREGQVKREDGSAYKPSQVPKKWDAIGFGMKGVPALEPMADAQASAFEIEKGLTTLRKVLAQRGVDLETHLNELSEERKLREQLGVLPMGEPGQVDPNAGDGGEDTGNRDPEQREREAEQREKEK